MSIKTKAELKGYFNKGDKPNESNYADLIDTMFNIAAPGTMVINIDPRVAYSSYGSPLHFDLQISTVPNFATLALTSNTYTSLSNWEYFNNVTFQPFTSAGLLSTYQNTTYGSVVYTWPNVTRNTEYYIRYRSWDGISYSNFKTEKRCL